MQIFLQVCGILGVQNFIFTECVECWGVHNFYIKNSKLLKIIWGRHNFLRVCIILFTGVQIG